nr:N-acetylglucosamine-6-sulfatase [Ciona intestinalis]XP_026690892.1 N-acetylglucosamine-6-sulfatase [Ciona intestinalis]|eukprot:XP_002128609.1 N-acetylglucosamine-6-sulfatase [Ciona intestinalis]
MIKLLFIALFGCICTVEAQLVMSKASPPPNIVFILTDDQDTLLGGMDPLVKVKKLLQDEGTTFTNMFTSTPLCCPSRASILTGRYSHNHETLNNTISGNCSSLYWQKTFETQTLAVAAQKANYRTFFAGKYLNQYGGKSVGGPQHVPVGWNQWFGLVGNSKYYNYTISDNGVPVQHGANYHEDYLTDLLANRSVDFIHNHKMRYTQPFFMMISTPAPHSPWDSAPQYSKMYENNTAPHTPSYNTKAVNKHWLVRQATHPMTKESMDYSDNAFRSRWRALKSVDDLVERVINALSKMKQLDNTYVFFSSDNGYHLGQFSLPIDKRQLYEFDLRVPLIIRGPGVSKNVTRSEPIVNVDIAPTVADIVNGGKGDFPLMMDGESLVPLLNSNNKPKWRSDFLVEYQGEGKDSPPPGCSPTWRGVSQCFPGCVCEDAYNNTYSCVRTLQPQHKVDLMYCEFTDTETFVELYNHTIDPHQLNNIKDTVDPTVLVKMNKRLIMLGLCSGKTCREQSYIDYSAIPTTKHWFVDALSRFWQHTQTLFNPYVSPL